MDARGAHGRRDGERAHPLGRVAARGVALIALAALLVAGCGGESQDKSEPSGNFKVQVLQATFPGKQSLAKRSTMLITVKNADSRTIPNVNVTVNSFDKRLNNVQEADPSRPVFVVNRSPVGSDSSNRSTYALGHSLAPGKTATFKWSVTATIAGPYRIRYEVAAGLFGKAQAVDSQGNPPRGQFAGTISNKAPAAKVSDSNGRSVVPGD